MITPKKYFCLGYTLVELLVTLSLMTFVFSVLFSMMSGGMRVWERLKCGVKQEHEIYLAFSEVKRGLHAYQPFEGIPFKGEHDQMSFASLVVVSPANSDAVTLEPGRRIFYFDKSRKALCQSDRPFRGARRESRVGNCKVLAEDIENVEFHYYVYNTGSKGFVWHSSWSDKQPPVAVKMELDYVEPCSEKKSRKEFLVSIPVGPIR